jgi:hypothetical protein
VNADLDALDRGVIEAGGMAAEALARIAALEATVAQLREIDAIMRRADADPPVLAAAERRAARSSRHLQVITDAPAGGERRPPHHDPPAGVRKR